MSLPPEKLPLFADQYAGLVKDVFAQWVDREAAGGVDLRERAQEYAERGKPEFVLAFLVRLDLAEPVKRELLAHAFERRAELSEQRAIELDAEHSRPFPLIGVEARKDRNMARQVRQGKAIRPYARAAKPLTMQ